MKCLCVLVFAVVMLGCAVEPVAGQDGAATSATATPTTAPTTTLHPATACIEDLRAIESARITPSLTPGADSGGGTPTAGTPTPTAEPGNEVTTALSVEIVNTVPRLTGVVTLETATTTSQIAILRQRTPGHPDYRDTLIDLLSTDSNIGPNVGPFGRGAALGMVDSLREPPLLTVDGDVATLTFLLPFDASVLAYSDDAQIPFDPWNVVTAGRDLVFRLEGGDDIPPTTTWWVATCFDGLDVVSIGDASDADASSAPIPTSPSGFGPFSPTPVASYLMPIVSDGPDRLLWKLSASTPREERVVAPRVRPNLITEFRLWLSTDWRWPLAAAWEYAGHFLIVLIPLAILWPLSRSGQSNALSAVLRRYRIASAAILVLLAVGLITTGFRAVFLLESSHQSGPASSPKGVTVDDGAGTADDGSTFAEGTDAHLDRTDVPAPVPDSAYLTVPLNASD